MDFGFSLGSLSTISAVCFWPCRWARVGEVRRSMKFAAPRTLPRWDAYWLYSWDSNRHEINSLCSEIESKNHHNVVNNVRKEFSVAVVTHHSTNVPIPLNWRTSSICAAAREQSKKFFSLFAKVKCSDSHFKCARVGTFFFCFSPSEFSLVESASLITREKRTAKIVM